MNLLLKMAHGCGRGLRNNVAAAAVNSGSRDRRHHAALRAMSFSSFSAHWGSRWANEWPCATRLSRRARKLGDNSFSLLNFDIGFSSFLGRVDKFDPVTRGCEI